MTHAELLDREKELQEKLKLYIQQAQSLQQAILVTRGRLEEVQMHLTKAASDGSGSSPPGEQ